MRARSYRRGNVFEAIIHESARFAYFSRRGGLLIIQLEFQIPPERHRFEYRPTLFIHPIHRVQRSFSPPFFLPSTRILKRVYRLVVVSFHFTLSPTPRRVFHAHARTKSNNKRHAIQGKTIRFPFANSFLDSEVTALTNERASRLDNDFPPAIYRR